MTKLIPIRVHSSAQVEIVLMIYIASLNMNQSENLNRIFLKWYVLCNTASNKLSFYLGAVHVINSFTLLATVIDAIAALA